MTAVRLRAIVEEVPQIGEISRWSEDDKGRCHTERWWETVTERLAGKDHKMEPVNKPWGAPTEETPITQSPGAFH